MELTIINQPRVFPYRKGYHAAKRAMDVVICLLALPVLFPVVAICAVAILLDSPGPVLFVQERIGKGGRAFRMYKFRTMRHDLDDSFHRTFMQAFVTGQVGDDGNGRDEGNIFLRMPLKEPVDTSFGANGNGEVYKPVQSTQITRVGRILRKTSLDELPQILNVLKGEMSLVGPRPNVVWEVEAYRSWHHERLEVLPGITGLAQVRGRSAISFDHIVRYDVEYVEKQSLALDFKVLCWTLMAVFSRAGAE